MNLEELIQQLEAIRQKLVPIRNGAMEDGPFDAIAGNAAFDALHAEVNDIVRSSPDRRVRAAGSRFLLLERWKPFESREASTMFSSTSARLPGSIEQRHQVGEMCAKLSSEILEFMRDDLADLFGEMRQGNRRPVGTGYDAADAGLVAEMSELIRQDQSLSATRAARLVVDRAPGGGTVDSKVNRLVKRYKASNGE